MILVNRSRFLALAAIAAVASLAGCGSGGDGTASAPLTKAEFIKQGDAICEKADGKQKVELQAYLKEHPAARSSQAGQEKMILEVGAPPIQSEAEELAALEPPADDQDEIGAIVEAIEEAVSKVKEDPSNLTTGAKGPFAKADKLARAYGFKACAQAL